MDWTLRKKILTGYGISLALMIVVLVWALVDLRKLGRASEAILSENYRSILAAETMIDSIERQDSASLLVLLGYRDEGLAEYRENENLFLQWFTRARDNITIEGEERILANIERGYSAYLVRFSLLWDISRHDPAGAALTYHDMVLPAFKGVRDACVGLREINSETMFQASGRARDIARKAAWSLTLIGATAVTMGLGFSLLLSNLLVRPLDRVMKATQKVAAGDYDVTVTTDSTDEFGRLSHEFNAMVQKLRAYREINIGQLVAEKRKSEAIIQRIDDGIVVMDHQFMVTSMNPSAAKMLNLQSKQAENRHFLEVVKSGELFDHLKAAAESGTVPMIEEGKNIFTTVEGDIKRHYQFFITPIDVQESHAPGTVLLLRDVSKLWEIDRLKSEFVMAASHELRTPLTSIGMSIDLLMENSTDKLNDQEKQLLAVAHEEIKRLKALVNSLLDLSKIEAGKVALEMQPVAASFLFEKAVSVLANQARDKSIDLSCVTPPGLPDVRADANKITWVLTNIIANALRYTAAGGSVRLSAEQVGPQMHVSVSDNGVGIPYDYQPKIFDKFVQIKGPGTTGGSGLGLAICREIVRAHGGSIWVDSIPGEGSTFTFTLPLAEGQPRGQHP